MIVKAMETERQIYIGTSLPHLVTSSLLFTCCLYMLGEHVFEAPQLRFHTRMPVPPRFQAGMGYKP